MRAHLLSLEGDGLVRQRGVQRGARKWVALWLEIKMLRDRKSRTSVGIGGTLLLIATVPFTTLKSSVHAAATMPRAANTRATNLRLGQGVQKRLPTIPPIDNERLKALNDKQSAALKRLNQLADDASLIGDSSARSRLLARIASLWWPYDESRGPRPA